MFIKETTVTSLFRATVYALTFVYFSYFLRGLYNIVKILNKLVFHTVKICSSCWNLFCAYCALLF